MAVRNHQAVGWEDAQPHKFEGGSVRHVKNDPLPCDDDWNRAFNDGIEAVLALRCMKHLAVRPLNSDENPGECIVCQIERLLSPGQPGFHVLRLVGNGDVSAGKGHELLVDVLLGKIGLGDLPCLNVSVVHPHVPTPFMDSPMADFCVHCGSPHGTHNTGCPAKP